MNPGSHSPEPELTISLFGPMAVSVRGAPLPSLRSRKGEWLLALLALRAGRKVERVWLAGTLWPDSPPSQALANMRLSLTDLRRALGPEALRLESPTPQTLRLDLAGARADVPAFDAAVAEGDEASLEEAVGLYGGPLLEGVVEEWVLQERLLREQAYLAALERLADHAQERGDCSGAERHLRRATGVDPLRESAQRALMQVLAAGGNYAAATQLYRELRLLLHREANAEPDASTRALYQQIRAEARERAATGRPLPLAGGVRDELALPPWPRSGLAGHLLSADSDRGDPEECRLQGLPLSGPLDPDLPREFPPLPIPGPACSPLPLPRTSLLGREADVAAVRELLGRDEVGMITLTGPGRNGQDASGAAGGCRAVE